MLFTQMNCIQKIDRNWIVQFSSFIRTAQFTETESSGVILNVFGVNFDTLNFSKYNYHTHWKNGLYFHKFGCVFTFLIPYSGNLYLSLSIYIRINAWKQQMPTLNFFCCVLQIIHQLRETVEIVS